MNEIKQGFNFYNKSNTNKLYTDNRTLILIGLLILDADCTNGVRLLTVALETSWLYFFFLSLAFFPWLVDALR